MYKHKWNVYSYVEYTEFPNTFLIDLDICLLQMQIELINSKDTVVHKS